MQLVTPRREETAGERGEGLRKGALSRGSAAAGAMAAAGPQVVEEPQGRTALGARYDSPRTSRIPHDLDRLHRGQRAAEANSTPS